jgi:peroxiredoxin
LRDAVEDIAALDASVAAIGTGDLDYARSFAAERGVTFPLMVDEASSSYRAVGTEKGSKIGLLNPKLALSGARAMAAGHTQGRSGPKQLVLGATHVILPDDSVPFAWINDDYDDNAPIDEVLAALR